MRGGRDVGCAVPKIKRGGGGGHGRSRARMAAAPGLRGARRGRAPVRRPRGARCAPAPLVLLGPAPEPRRPSALILFLSLSLSFFKV